MGTTSFASFAIREALIEAMVGDLLGPADGEDEIVDEQNVRGRYLVWSMVTLAPACCMQSKKCLALAMFRLHQKMYWASCPSLSGP